MLNYVARRLLLMLPTVVGITFIVFLLLALSPGGIGAAAAAAGGQQDASKAAMLEAYLEDRYGLNDPVLVQYVRWLHRISPVKFGTRDQVTPAGERLQPPKEIPDPPLAEWGGFTLPFADAAPPGPALAGGSVEERQRAYRRIANDALAARSRYLGAKREFESVLGSYARFLGRDDWLDAKGRVVVARVATEPADRTNELWPEIDKAFAKMAVEWKAATERRNLLSMAFAERPFAESGLPVLPGAIWVGPPDLGTAFSKSRPVADLIADALPVTLLLNLIAFPIIYLVAIPSGILASARSGSWFDKLSGATYVALWSVPTVWAGVLAVGYLASDEYLGLFPVSGLHDRAADAWTFLPGMQADGSWQVGWLGDALWHLVLPVACLVYGGFAVLSKQTRAAMLDNFNADYVRTAKAKGVARRDVVMHHVFRNSLLPLITMFVTVFPATLAGSVVIERIFSVPGMGSLILDAINQRDRELILANTFMIACVNLTALLLADILYAVADPRVSYE